MALRRAREAGPESIRTFTNSLSREVEPVEFLS
jgi:hypothetical protein